MDSNIDREFLTNKEAADEVKTSLVTLWRERTRKTGALPYYRIGGQVRFRRDELLDHMRRCAQDGEVAK